MSSILLKSSVQRVKAAMLELSMNGEIRVLEESARTAAEAASALGIETGQIASSIVFRLLTGEALLVITSGRHRVDTQLVAENLSLGALGRADANFVKEQSGYSVGGVAPVGWLHPPRQILIDQSLASYPILWAAAGHPHTVFPTSFDELSRVTGGRAMIVSRERDPE
jgi:prolyl-tRNA editing enzyme YbaK/EbsC (Cys-tRNA(Pro) deacylase)